MSSSRCFSNTRRTQKAESVPQPLLGLRGETVVLRRADHLQLADGARLRERPPDWGRPDREWIVGTEKAGEVVPLAPVVKLEQKVLRDLMLDAEIQFCM